MLNWLIFLIKSSLITLIYEICPFLLTNSILHYKYFINIVAYNHFPFTKDVRKVVNNLLKMLSVHVYNYNLRKTCFM